MILQIALDVPIDKLFSYSDGGGVVSIGQRVLVPFGNRKLIGIVIQMVETVDIPADKIKSVIRVFDDEDLVTRETFNLVRFASDYYQYPFGQALLSILPSRLRQAEPSVSRQRFIYNLTSLGMQSDIKTISTRKLIQIRIIELLHKSGNASESALNAISPSWRKSIDQLIEMKWVKAQQVFSGFHEVSFVNEPGPVLNSDQARAVDAVMDARDQYKPFLLHGITGSGKTEVYMRILDRMLKDNDGQALVLVPEINLTPQLELRFKARLPHLPLVALHSNLNEGDRLDHWKLAQSGEARIVIGTRLSVFTPLPKLKVIVVDEEHDGSYKQQDSMRYHARDVAMVRANRANIPIVLGSATPSLESWYNAKQGRYTYLDMSGRAVINATMPDIRCVDTTRVVMKDGLSQPLINALKDRLEKREQSLLFINRRGYSPVLLCNACFWIAPCMRCSGRLVVHLRQRKLKCHHCGHEQKIVEQCPDCGNADLLPTGHGTQRLEETLSKIIPDARIVRVDRDSTRNKNALSDIIKAVNDNQVDILVGTQMLAKGHDFPNLTLVGVIDTDSALFSPDFRASERLFSQMMQVSGRSGRAQKAGEVLIQTAFPDHALFNALRTHDYPAYADTLMQERSIAHFPPFSFFALLRAEANQYKPVQDFLMMASEMAREMTQEVMVYDPLRPQIEKMNGMERGHLLFQADNRISMQSLLRLLVPQLREMKGTSQIRWSMDVDPLEF